VEENPEKRTRYHVAYRRLVCSCTPEAEQNETWRLRNLSESQPLLPALVRSRGILSLQPLTTGGLDGENLYNRLPDPVERLERDAPRLLATLPAKRAKPCRAAVRTGRCFS